MICIFLGLEILFFFSSPFSLTLRYLAHGSASSFSTGKCWISFLVRRPGNLTFALCIITVALDRVVSLQSPTCVPKGLVWRAWNDICWYLASLIEISWLRIPCIQYTFDSLLRSGRFLMCISLTALCQLLYGVIPNREFVGSTDTEEYLFDLKPYAVWAPEPSSSCCVSIGGKSGRGAFADKEASG